MHYWTHGVSDWSGKSPSDQSIVYLVRSTTRVGLKQQVHCLLIPKSDIFLQFGFRWSLKSHSSQKMSH